MNPSLVTSLSLIFWVFFFLQEIRSPNFCTKLSPPLSKSWIRPWHFTTRTPRRLSWRHHDHHYSFLYYRLGIILHQRGHGHSHGIPEKKAKSKKPQASPSSFIIVEEEEENVNVRAAFIHVLGDFLQSVGVFIAALLVWFKVSDLLHFTWLPFLL